MIWILNLTKLINMKTLYLLRHLEKAWANGKKPSALEGAQHDPCIKVNEIKSETLDNLKDVTFDKMYCSPFLRCRQTAQLFLTKTNREPKFIISKEIGEFLGNQRRSIPEVQRDTAVHYNPVEFKQLTTESIKRMKFRVKKFIENLPSEGTFLIISHGIILREICDKEIPEGELYIHTIN